MLENITLSADERLIRKARKKAQQEHTTLTSQFRQWLESYTGIDTNPDDYQSSMEYMSYAKPEKQYSRDELKEKKFACNILTNSGFPHTVNDFLPA